MVFKGIANAAAIQEAGSNQLKPKTCAIFCVVKKKVTSKCSIDSIDSNYLNDDIMY